MSLHCVLGAMMLLGCDSGPKLAKNTTGKGTVLVEWSRADAKQGSPFAAAGPKHPVADAKIVEGPKDRSYAVTFKDAEGLSYAVDLRVEFAKVAYTDSKVVRWASTAFRATLASNDGFDVGAKCYENLSSMLDTLSEADALATPSDTQLFCLVWGRRPNSKGMENAIDVGGLVSVSGSGDVTAPGNRAEIVAK